MTKSSISLTELAEKGSDVDVLSQMIQYVAQRLMDLDVEVLAATVNFPFMAIENCTLSGFLESVSEAPICEGDRQIRSECRCTNGGRGCC